MSLRNGAYSFDGMSRARIGRLARSAAISAESSLIAVSRSPSRATALSGIAGIVHGQEG